MPTVQSAVHRVPCPECGKRCRPGSGLSRHRSMVHGVRAPKSSRNRPAPDPVYAAKLREGRARNRASDAERRQMRYVCKCCGIEHPSPEAMGRHMGVRD